MDLRRELQIQIAAAPSILRLEDCLGRNRSVAAKGVVGSLKALVVAHLSERFESQVVYLAADPEEGENLREDLQGFLGEKRVVYFPPVRRLHRADQFLDKLPVGQRLEALEKLLGGESCIVIVPAQALAWPMPSATFLRKGRLEFHVGEEKDFDRSIQTLIAMGYTREPTVMNPGEISVRGGIVDVYPLSRESPIRIEFFGDLIESIRQFAPSSQRSIAHLKEVTIYPHPFPGGDGKSRAIACEEDNGLLADYLRQDAIVVIDEPERVVRGLGDQEAAIGDFGYELNPRLGSPGRASEMLRQFQGFRQVRFFSLSALGEAAVDFGAKPQEALGGSLELLGRQIEQICERDPSARVYFLCDTEGQAQRMEGIFSELGLTVPQLRVTAGRLHAGFHFPEAGLVVYTDHQFYGRVYRRRAAKEFKGGLTLRAVQELRPGDFVVHIDYGIGVFGGLEKITVGGHERECLVLVYKDADKLYVPIERLDRLQKYSSREGAVPTISKLGSGDWDRLKRRTKRRIQDIARDLIDLYAMRKASEGYAFSPDTLWQRELEASFPYEDTADQLQATIDVKRDMESPRPMDRLVCGDVGYGKTEIAVRAAFKAVNEGKQVAMLVPTTILAEQHYTTFCGRLAPFPVKVEMLSRFRTFAEQKRILQGLRAGTIDIVIGTHRLLSNDVAFKDLGLVIIDEEQRFGVRHKEKLKKLRATVDVLTLTATPIPRTLHMALMGARDMSNITTPPRGRLPIITEVVPFDKGIIRDAILQEVGRGGQVFFVHNRVRSIDAVANMLRKLVPEVSLAIAHGQMKERDLERVMLNFLNRKHHVLVTTMIVESGLDIPNANTIIINRADQLGLSQLYQLRGRVGRSHQQAYAYLLIPSVEALSRDALKRLQTIEECTELGSGFQIAMRDLEIRGAGNLLGPEQSGFIDALGFDLYCKILDEAVRELKGEKLPAGTLKPEEIQIEVDADVYLPQDYVERGEDRVDIYRRLAEIEDLDGIEEIREELRDRFGQLPPPAENLLHYIGLRVLAEKLGLQRVSLQGRQLWAEFPEEAWSDPTAQDFRAQVRAFLDKASQPFTFVQGKGLGLRVQLDGKDSSSLLAAKNFLHRLL